MRLGMLLRSGWRNEVADDVPPAHAFERMLDEAAAALDEGVTGLWVYDHLEGVPMRREAPCFEAWTTLAVVAARLVPERLGPLVSGVVLRNVGLLSKMAATVDAVSGGRLVMGLGAGWYRDELRRHGYAVPPFAERVTALDEAIDALRALWSGATVSTGGPSRLADAVSRPAPSQGIGLPIWLGGSSERIQALAATKADGINLGGPPDVLGPAIERFRQRCAATGREPAALTVSAEVQVFVDPDCALLAACARQSGASVAEFAAANIVGSPDEVADKASHYARAGVDELIFFLPSVSTPDEVRRTATLLSEVGDHDA